MPKKTSQNSTRVKKVSKTVTETPYQSIQGLLAWGTKDADKKRVRWIFEKFYEWSLKPTSWSHFDFCDEFGIPRSIYYRLLKNNPEYQVVHEHCMSRIGSRREKLAVRKDQDCNPGVIMQTLRVYNHDWKKVYQEEVALKTMMAEKSGNEPVTVTIQRDAHACSAG